jgi:aspartate aminotransferase
MPTMTLAPRMACIQASPASILRRHARDLRAAGRDIIDLSSGDLDFATPDHVRTAAQAAAARGETRYTNVEGTAELRDAVRAKLNRQNGLSFQRDEIVICNGSTQALFNALFATLAPGDEVIVPAPYWAPYLEQVRLAEGVSVVVPCPQNNGFRLRAEDLRAALTPRTRWIIINNPVNPSGAVYSATELRAIADVLLDHPGIFIAADGLYEDIVFNGRRAPTIVEVEPRLKPRTLVVGGVAKSYAMMGWRIGYAAGPSALIAAMIKIQSQTTSCASSISQAAAHAALTGPQDLLHERAGTLEARRNAFVELLNGCEGISCAAPQGTFYIFASCAGVIGKHPPHAEAINSDRDFAAYLLDRADVAVLPGTDCGLSPYFRVSFANAPPTIEDAANRIRRACAELR